MAGEIRRRLAQTRIAKKLNGSHQLPLLGTSAFFRRELSERGTGYAWHLVPACDHVAEIPPADKRLRAFLAWEATQVEVGTTPAPAYQRKRDATETLKAIWHVSDLSHARHTGVTSA